MTIALRRARPADCELLFEWVNSPDSLASKLLTREPIARHDHDAWFEARLADPDSAIWIAELGGVPVGQVRFMLRDGAYDVDVYIDPPHRGSGAAAAALTQAIEEFRPVAGKDAIFRARIKNDNQMSVRLFEKLGFRLTARSAENLTYIL